MSDDVILLSSEDEFDSPPPKKLKTTSGLGCKEALAKLNRLKDITAAPCSEKTLQYKKYEKVENRLTIVIADDKISKENENNVVDLLDESPDESISEKKDINTSSDCLILGSDSEDEKKTPPPSITQNGHGGTEVNGQESEEKRKLEISLEERVEILLNQENIETNGDNLTVLKEELRIETKIETIESDLLNRPSTSTASDAHKLLDEFLETCAKSMKGSKYEIRVLSKFLKMKKNFEKCHGIHGEPNLKKMLQEHIATAKISAPEAVVSFQRIYSYLLDYISGDSVEVPEEDIKKLQVLEKTCKKILKKIRRLEAMEINFDDEEDSTYMQIDRYSQRLNKVYNTYCRLLKISPYAGRLLHDKIRFVSSKYDEINQAITKSYKINKFPSYGDIEKCVRKCVTKNNLPLSESEILEESKNCFTKMGNLLQMRRKKELYDVHCGFIALNEDPANTDENLKSKLQQNLQQGEKTMKEIVEKYVKLQENNVSMELSEDSDDSNYKESESESEA